MKTALNILVGVDEVATGTQQCQGWTCFMLPERYVPNFTKETRAICDKYTLTGFHAKKFKKEQKAAYTDFLLLVVEYMKKSMQSRLANCLLAESLATTVKDGFKKIAVESFNEATITDTSVKGTVRWLCYSNVLNKPNRAFLRLKCADLD